MRIKERTINQNVYSTCMEHGYPEIVARVIAGRTETFDRNIFEFSLDAIKPAETMADCTRASQRIARAIQDNETILLFTDYDVDGCTSMAVLYGTLHDVFEVPDSRIIRLTGHRTLDGYGLTDPVADKIISLRQNPAGGSEQNPGPTLVITADTGISDGTRIERVADAGIDVIVTDHHLIPREGVPEAAFAVVNPQRENCQYDPRVAGCGVTWLLMTALSKEMGCTLEQKIKIHQLLDHVALGTVADLVPLTSSINRYFVKKGLEFINRKIRPCWQVALNGRWADSGFLGFQLAPRINASSRITCEAATALDFLIERDPDRIAQAYEQLDLFNSERQQLEKEMFEEAKKSLLPTEQILICYSQNNHPGIQGIVAGRLTENFGTPAIMLADVGDGVVSGSGRAGQFLHMREALQRFDDRFPGILLAYGGHRGAAGFKLHRRDIDLFRKELSTIVAEQLEGQDTTPYIQTDGSLKGGAGICLDTYYQIESLNPFGMGFPAPLFHDQMVATDLKVMGRTPVHLSMLLDGVKAAFFNALEMPGDPLPINSGELVDVVYALNLNSWKGRETLQLIIKKITPLDQSDREY